MHADIRAMTKGEAGRSDLRRNGDGVEAFNFYGFHGRSTRDRCRRV